MELIPLARSCIESCSTSIKAMADHGGDGNFVILKDDEVETVAPGAPVTSQRFVSPHLLDAIPYPSESSRSEFQIQISSGHSSCSKIDQFIRRNADSNLC